MSKFTSRTWKLQAGNRGSGRAGARGCGDDGVVAEDRGPRAGEDLGRAQQLTGVEAVLGADPGHAEGRHAAAELEHLGASAAGGLDHQRVVALGEQPLLPRLAGVGAGDVLERAGRGAAGLTFRSPVCRFTYMSTRTIAVDAEVYERLAAVKRRGESFSKVIDRLLDDLAEAHTGLDILSRMREMPALSADDAERMLAVVRESRKDETWAEHDRG